VQLALDVALAAVGAVVGTGKALVRPPAKLLALGSHAVLRPRFVPARLQPATVLGTVALRGAARRVQVARAVDQAVARLDLAAIVSRYVDLDEVVRSVDVPAVVDRIDLVAVVEEVLAAIDLPAIIRDSTGSLTSETVRSARLTGISADDAISRSIERLVFRRRSPAVSTTADPE
jgi:hypothetical protein